MKSPSDSAKPLGGTDARVESGTLHGGHGLDWTTQPGPAKKEEAIPEEDEEKAEEEEDEGFDWGAPVSSAVGASGGMDWSQPVTSNSRRISCATIASS